METVVRALLGRGRARVVILFIYRSMAKKLLRLIVTILETFSTRTVSHYAAVNNLNATGHFVWIASDAWLPERRNAMTGLEKETVGTFSVKYQSRYIPGLYRHIAELLLAYDETGTPTTNVSNRTDGEDTCGSVGMLSPASAKMLHYLRETSWNSLTDCDTTNPNGREECLYRKNATVETILSKMDVSASTSLTVDAVWTFARAADRLISEHCPGATGQAARECIHGDILLDYVKRQAFNGSSGVVKFDALGDARGRYLIKQIVMGPKEDLLGLGLNDSQDIGLNAKIVAYYDIEKRLIGFTENSISWNHLTRVDSLARDRNLEGNEAAHSFENDEHDEYYGGEASQDRYLFNNMNYNDLEDGSTPESVCSRPCQPGEFIILREPAPCCWECRRCRENERVFRSNTSCESCAEFYWPDPETAFRTCTVIPVTYPQISELLPTLQIFLGVLAMVTLLIIVACFIHFRESRVIKAASRELSILQMSATFIGYVTVILFQTIPSAFTCGALYFLFCLSFALLYCPLLVKAVRIFRIFNSSTKGTRRPKFVSPVSQVMMTICLVLVQVRYL
ncbi:metabotropic glutamate receptor-like [Elysia marginata]|uniref:Metabotropic glutamate receptor-like n=1 Tax=Elysia marginata TaxID=1093978 RepID=A0AAV4IS40_9GAST|nr:metabotropic glutamate receptor-like [Elysia marginata]